MADNQNRYVRAEIFRRIAFNFAWCLVMTLFIDSDEQRFYHIRKGIKYIPTNDSWTFDALMKKFINLCYVTQMKWFFFGGIVASMLFGEQHNAILINVATIVSVAYQIADY